MLPMVPISLSRLLANTAANSNGCLEWLGALGGSRGMYGVVWTEPRPNRRRKYAHRLVWEAIHGPLKKGECVLHKCDNPRCVNPTHLFSGTQADNMRDMAQKGRGGAPKGAKHASAKLSEAQALEVLSSDKPSAFFTDKFGVSRQSIYAIRAGITWRHLPRKSACS